MKDPNAWIQTYTGKKFYPLDPEETEYCIEDIAHALSNICRFTGHGAEFYSVAQHSALVSQGVSPKNALWGLMHDASEAYIADVARPLKHLPEFAAYRDIESRTMNAICKTFGLKGKEPKEVKTMDDLLLRNEAKCLNMLNADWKPHYALPDLGLDIIPLSPMQAKKMFIRQFWRISSLEVFKR